MSNATPDTPTRNHVLLIGIDAYPSNPLEGCVNDVLALSRLLQERFAVKPEEITALTSPLEPSAAPNAGPANAARIRQELEALASDTVKPRDRVIIHYSGHGGSQQVTGQQHSYLVESILPVDYEDSDANCIFDLEFNGLLARIAARTRNLSVLLDCCHSAGASKDSGKTRSVVFHDRLSAERYAEITQGSAPTRASGLAKGIDGAPFILAACKADELAAETWAGAGRRMGKLTLALTRQIETLTPEQLEQCSWRELRPQLLSATQPQHPTLTGDDKRIPFGPNTSRDPGELRVTPCDDGSFVVHAGTLLEVSEETTIAVYGDEPAYLPPRRSPEAESARLALLEVVHAEQAQSTAHLVDAIENSEWPAHPRCRVESYGLARLRVAFEGASVPESIREDLEGSEIEIVDDESKELATVVDNESKKLATVRLIAAPGGDRGEWLLWDDRLGPWTKNLPAFARFAQHAIVPILTHCIRWQAPLRLADRCDSGGLELRLLDASGPIENPQDHDGEDLAGPGFPRYRVPFGKKYCIRLINLSQTKLHTTLLGVGSDGVVVQLGTELVEGGDKHDFWLPVELGGKLGEGLWVSPPAGIDRIVAIGTSNRTQALHELATPDDMDFDRIIQDAHAPARGGFRGIARRPPPERWTSAVLTLMGVELTSQ